MTDDRPRLGIDTDARTVVLSLKGADLTAFLGGQLTRDEGPHPHRSPGVLECRHARMPADLSPRPDLAGCGGPTIDLKTALQTADISTGWLDQGVVDGKNKIVPSVTFVQNVSNQNISTLAGNVIFRRNGENDELGNGFASPAPKAWRPAPRRRI